MKKERYVVLACIICIIITIISVYYHIASYEPEEPNYYKFIWLDLYQSDTENGYIFTIILTSSWPIEPSEYEWWVSKNGVTNYNDFPIISGKGGSTTDKNITVTWFDIDLNKKLSVNDTIHINTNGQDIRGYTFIIQSKEHRTNKSNTICSYDIKYHSSIYLDSPPPS